MGLLHKPRHHIRAFLIQTQLHWGQQPRVFLQQPHDEAFAINGGHRADPDVHAGAPVVDLDMAILRHEPFGNVHVGHDLDAGNQRGMKVLGGWRFLLQ